MSDIYAFPQAKQTLATPKPNRLRLHTGTKLWLDAKALDEINSVHGLVGGYQINVDAGGAVSPGYFKNNTVAYIWDEDFQPSSINSSVKQAGEYSQSIAKCRLQGNCTTLLTSNIIGPNLEPQTSNGELLLTQTCQFELRFDTAACDASLGVITLVESLRFANLENGEKIDLCNTQDVGSPVLYLDNEQDKDVVKILCSRQKQGNKKQYQRHQAVYQSIPESINGIVLESVSVLEKYHTYFMQKPLVPDTNTIWIPVIAPITWGWSIKVGHVNDHWYLARRKLMLPTTGNNGLELPSWQNNIQQFIR